MSGSQFVVAVLLLQIVPSPQPSPQPSPLKQIIEVKSRTLCSALRDNVAVSLAGLMKNDRIIEVGRNALRTMGEDKVTGSTSHMASLAAENVVGSMVHNLAVIDSELNDPARFPKTPRSSDEHLADTLKAQLQAIEDQQKIELNVLNGTIQTDDLNSMQHDLPENTPAVSGSSGNAAGGAAASSPAPTTIAKAGLPNTPDAPAATDSRVLAGNDLIGNTLYGRLAASMAQVQRRTAGLESIIAASVEQAAQECRSASPPP
jgi:hypothetical protein